MPWKLYVDSRKRVPGARGDSDSDFAIQLPYPIEVSGKAYVDVVLLTNNAHTIYFGNERIYLDEGSAQTKRVTTLAHGQYNVQTLKDALMVALNTGRTVTGQYRVTYESKQNRFQIDLVNPASSDSFRIWQDDQLKEQIAAWQGITTISVDNIRSANRVCGFTGNGILVATSNQVVIAPKAPDVQRHKQLFLRSSLGGGSHQSLGPNGETDIIRRIVVGNASHNSVIVDAHGTVLDSVKINGTPELNTIWFQLCDVDGTVVDTHGLPLSFSIIFVDVVEE